MSQLYPFTDPIEIGASPPKVIVAGEGCTVIDADGNRYLDAAAGLWSASLGYSDERLIRAATAQMEVLPWYYNFMGRSAAPTERLASALVDKLPPGLGHVFFACTGSEAVDSAVKVARFYQNARGLAGKKTFIASDDAYHGSGTMSAALSSMSYMHAGFDLPTTSVLRAGSHHHRAHARPGESEPTFSARRAVELDELICAAGADTICGFIGEPVIGSGGAIPPPAGYWPAIQEVLDAHDVMLVADEIITGFGRTGRWFATETYGLRPGLLTMAKQLSASYFPISALAIHDDIYDVIAAEAHELGMLGHGFTHGGHPVGAAVALEALAIYEELDLERQVAERAGWLHERLAAVDELPDVREVRHIGLLAGIELEPVGPPGDVGRRIGEAAEDRGVLLRVIDDTIAISPPLIISRTEIDQIIDVLVDSIDATRSQAVSADPPSG